MSADELIALCVRLGRRDDPEIRDLIGAVAALLDDLATARAQLAALPAGQVQTLRPLSPNTPANQP